jgi:hypothetical protein
MMMSINEEIDIDKGIEMDVKWKNDIQQNSRGRK